MNSRIFLVIYNKSHVLQICSENQLNYLIKGCQDISYFEIDLSQPFSLEDEKIQKIFKSNPNFKFMYLMYIIRSDKKKRLNYFKKLYIFLFSHKFSHKFGSLNDRIEFNNFPYIISSNEIYSLISNKINTSKSIEMLSFFYENDIELKNKFDEYVDKIY